MPLVEVESILAGPHVATRFGRAVTHDNGGVFCSPDGAAFHSNHARTLCKSGLVVAAAGSTTASPATCHLKFWVGV
jgi:hypothetical protein